MKKKVVMLLTTVATCAALMMACGNTEAEAPVAEPAVEEGAEVQDDTAADVEAPAEDAADVEAPVEISGTVRRRDLAGNHNVILYDLRLTELIHSHKLGYRMGRRHLDFLIFARLRIFSRKDRSELIAGSDRHKGQHRCCYLI